jgi:hypothetical protein
VTFRYRAVIVPRLPAQVTALFPRLNHYTQLSTFSDQFSAGLSSSAFDIEANLRDGDSRSGLDEQGVHEVTEIMRRERVGYVPNSNLIDSLPILYFSFDQARLIRQNRLLARNGIDPSGQSHALYPFTLLILGLQACHWIRRPSHASRSISVYPELYEWPSADCVLPLFLIDFWSIATPVCSSTSDCSFAELITWTI